MTTDFLRNIFRADEPCPNAANLDGAKAELSFLATFYSRIVELEQRDRIRALRAGEDDTATRDGLEDVLRLLLKSMIREVVAAERLNAPQLSTLIATCRQDIRQIESSLMSDQEFFAGTPDRMANLERLVNEAIADDEAGHAEPIASLT